MTEFVSRAVRLDEPKVDINGKPLDYSTVMRKYGYVHDAEIHTLQRHYFDEGVVAFTDAVSNISRPEFEFIPYQNGIHSWPAVKMHEETHIRIQKKGGIQDEKAINNYVTYILGYTVFPFPSY